MKYNLTPWLALLISYPKPKLGLVCKMGIIVMPPFISTVGKLKRGKTHKTYIYN